MIAAIRAEFRKLLSVRSTYFIAILALLIGTGLISFWIFGYKDADHIAVNPGVLRDCLSSVISVVGLFLSFIAVLLVGHEYRYNTIMYTLTATNRRTKTYFAKLIALTVTTVILAAIIVGASVLLFRLGLQVGGHTVQAAQQMAVWTLVWHAAVHIVGNIVFAFIVTMLLRNLIGAIAFILVVPSTVENLLGLLLHDNVKYLPYTALGKFAGIDGKDYAFSLAVVAGYAVIGGLIAWLAFLRRDAN